jgi:ABC-type sugar transport system substrate-binding protein
MAVKKLKFVLSIPGDTTYQRAQAAAAQAIAHRLGAELEVVIAQMDSVAQGQQLLTFVQARTDSRPNAIIIEPVSAAGLPRVAEAAVAAGIAWIVSNAHVDYIGALRKIAKVPVFQVSQDHMEVGRLQGKQIGAILPKGGSVLYLRGPAMSWWATKRFEGMERMKPKNVEVRSLKVLSSSAEGARHTVSSWLDLTKHRPEGTQLIVSQNTDFLTGANEAFEMTSGADRAKWLTLPRTGVGVSERSRPLVDQGALCATVVTSLTLDTAVEMLARSMKDGSQPPEHTFVEAYSYPGLDELARKMVDVGVGNGRQSWKRDGAEART